MKGLYKRSRNIAWDDYPVKAKTSTARKAIKRINEKKLRKQGKKRKVMKQEDITDMGVEVIGTIFDKEESND